MEALAEEHILDSLSKLYASIESPDDTVQRFTFYNMQLACIRTAIDLALFERLTQTDSPLTVDQLSESTGANPVFMGRLLRYLASYYAVQKVAKDTFTASTISRTFSQRGFQAAVGHLFNNAGPSIQELLAWLKENGYPDIQDNVKTPFQRVMHTELPAFLWLQQQPENLAFFNKHMKANRFGMPTFLDVFPTLEKTTGLSADRALFVDVGGGFGQQVISFRDKYSQLEGRVIVQDLAPTTANAVQYPGVEFMAHDFFTPQPCLEILKNIKDVMAPDSYILVDDMVLPNVGVHWQQAQLDMLMMAALGARERTQEQWTELFQSAGLKINQVHTYTESLKDSIIEVIAG
ncbi:S-adenosyl-L-methionine-dependent methyltransferase [Aspergillus sclerotioniger CBS 115572]|uniref:S-adenosyl-L-methionine-dependent methyltransferase n=1 Tax=Aspergillus sclerotioniger CBS 115572 TaxID=1450535 RepID=A0A317WZG5_9EURO|nr:S-adenosyl-L-methionine-dependent methyltransferase [Aspergillus sclerotioniger CBS 115572]PWY91774.1 S-adenosyl-L-methionine-dependent methyltransferase [Aspergillus sclerotioniger CBS 115572]